MKKILYISNIEVPYRVRFFNKLSKICDLTVLYERRISSNRDNDWAFSENITYKIEYLDGIKIGNEYSFSLRILNVISKGWDLVIVGCYNSKVQIMAIVAMRLLNIPFAINIDGEPFIDNSIKGKIKKCILHGAKVYLTAGENSAKSLRYYLGDNSLIKPYYFSSLSIAEIQRNNYIDSQRNKTVLVVGQYYDYKGMDVAFKVACKDCSIHYKFVGMGNRTEKFLQDFGGVPTNIEVIPFLSKEQLEEEYKTCGMLLLPSRQECWGLVVNEAASFGMPIVSTWGSGAAVEFLGSKYTQYLAKANNVDELYHCLKQSFNVDNTQYAEYLKKKSQAYSIEKSVEVHMNIINAI